MTYDIIKDPYCTGDKWYKEYELVEDRYDSEQVLEFLIDNCDSIPDVIEEFPVDGADGVVCFEIYPKDILTEEHEEAFINFLKEEGLYDEEG